MRTDTEHSGRKRGRPREFIEDDVLDRVRTVFVEKGFAAASLDDLAAAAGLNRPSLYAAFGDKEQLFIQTIRRTGDRTRAALLPILQRSDPIEERLATVYKATVAAYCMAPRQPGCLVVGAATGAAVDHPGIGDAARQFRRDMEDVFEAAFSRCVSERQLPDDPPPALRAKLAVAILDTLSVRARLGESRAALEAFAQDAIALICMV